MTLYILAGGEDRAHDDYGVNVATLVKKHVSEHPHILSCFFAKPEDTWEESGLDWQLWFRRYFGSLIGYEVANTHNFIEQIKHANVIYIHGGHTVLLQDVMKQFPDLKKHFQNKIVIGSSAGANFLSSHGYSPSARKVINGSGIVPMSVIVHYGSETIQKQELLDLTWDDVDQLMRRSSPEMPVTHLREGELITYQA